MTRWGDAFNDQSNYNLLETLVLEKELKTYFRMSSTQIDFFKGQWEHFYELNKQWYHDEINNKYDKDFRYNEVNIAFE